MGQAQSAEASPAEAVDQIQSQPLSSSSVAPHDSSHHATSMESLIAEAAAYGIDENESLDAKAQKALESPCIADLRNGPCGVQFSDAFLCFLKSTAEEKDCMKANPKAFSKDILDEEEDKKDEKEAQEYKIIPPVWLRESPSPKSKL